ncbi:MAG: DUF4097 family beta strand repeat protein [Ignavibacteriae bacterium]|nr:DUF4097 family beta strand repeat protein [Ignavibacteria bacterium]MBI3364055.1 DUF4097 family beta strand repeat protein [Ignavibacteriota bacterium]
MNIFHRSILLLFCISLLSATLFADQRDDGERSQTKSFKVEKGGRLKVSVSGGDIRIVPWEKNEVLVKVRGAEDDDLDRLEMTSHDNSVYVENYSGGDWSGDMRFDISVPSQFDLDLQTSNGNLEIQGTLTGKVLGSTSAGDIRLGNLNGTVDVSTSGGDIRSADIQGDLTLNTSGGDIIVGIIGGTADISTSGGNITIDDVKKTLWAKTAGGDIHVGDVGGEATLSTAGGNVIVGKVSGSAKLTTAGGDVELQGASGIVKAKTAGGNLILYNITGSIDGKTAGGDIEAELNPSGNGTNRLSTASGVIRLYLPENAKATITATIRVDEYGEDAADAYRIRSSFKSKTYEFDEHEGEIRATYVLNGGGENISLETSNADIEIRKLGERKKHRDDD